MAKDISLKPKEIITELLEKNGHFPNNPHLPLLLYKHALDLRNDLNKVNGFLTYNGWKNCWTDSIYTFHHYHSNTHEVLAMVRGSCKVQMGGPEGPVYHVTMGDILIIPGGVSHKNVGATDDFQCVGAYPIDIEYDMCYGKENELSQAEKNINKIPLPKSDPIYGLQGPLFDFWH